MSLDLYWTKEQPEGGCISPKDLLNVGHGTDDFSIFRETYDIGNLQPGCRFELFYNPLPTPQAIIDGTYIKTHGQCIITIVPRLPNYLEKPFLPSITFNHQGGKPGPYIIDLLQERIDLDRPSDFVFMDQGWRQTRLTIDWPGKQLHSTCISCMDKDGRHLTRKDVAKLVSLSVSEIFRDGKDGRPCKWGSQVIHDPDLQRWNLATINFDRIRLMAINYYRKTWVAVLAVDDLDITEL